MLGLSPETVRSYIRSGKLRTTAIPRIDDDEPSSKWKVHRDDLDAFILRYRAVRSE